MEPGANVGPGRLATSWHKSLDIYAVDGDGGGESISVVADFGGQGSEISLATVMRAVASLVWPPRPFRVGKDGVSVQSHGYTSIVDDTGHPVDAERVAAARQGQIPADEAEAMGALLTLVADPLRARILSALVATDELCVGDIALALDATEDAVSYALRILRTAGLVRRRREGRMGYYRLRDGEMRTALLAALDQLRSLTRLHPERLSEDEEDR